MRLGLGLGVRVGNRVRVRVRIRVRAGVLVRVRAIASLSNVPLLTLNPIDSVRVKVSGEFGIRIGVNG